MERKEKLNNSGNDAIIFKKNPLAQALGIVLRELRKENGRTSDTVRGELKLGESNYRMIESGRTLLQPDNALRIKLAFPETKLDSIAKVLVALHILEVDGKDVDSFRQITKRIGDIDFTLKPLFQKLNLACNKSSVANEELQNVNAVSELKTFLLNSETTRLSVPLEKDRYLSPVIRSEIKSIFNNLPSYYTDQALAILKGFNDLSPYIEQKKLGGWEAKNINEFKSIVGITNDPSLLIGTTSNVYDYAFLWQRGFENLQIIITDGQPKDITKQLTKKLFAEKEKNKKRGDISNKLTSNNDAKKKIEILHASSQSANLVLTYEKGVWDTLWIYNFKNENSVGIINRRKPKPDNTIFVAQSLSYAETRNKLEEFNDLWSKQKNKK